MKRRLILLVSVLAALALAACSVNGGKGSERGVQASESAAQVSEDASGEASLNAQDGSETSLAMSESAPATPEPVEATPEPYVPTPKPEPVDPYAMPGQPFRDPRPDPTPIPDDPVEHGYTVLELNGNRDDRFLTTEYCYLRSDKYVMFFDKDLSIPGDFKEKIDLIVDEVEKTVNLPYNATYYVPERIYYDYLGYNPWEGIELNKRIAIFVFVDREDAAYVSSANGENLHVFEYNLISDKVWNSVSSYRDNSWRRGDYFDYAVMAHELTHVLTDRYANMTWAMTEGCAEYIAETVMERLKDTSEDFQKSYENLYLHKKIKKKVTSKSVLKMKMAKCGGFAISLREIRQD